MASWLDMAIVGSAIAAAGLYTWRIYRRDKAACAKGCGTACGTRTSTDELVQLGRPKDRTLLADSRGNR